MTLSTKGEVALPSKLHGCKCGGRLRTEVVPAGRRFVGRVVCTGCGPYSTETNVMDTADGVRQAMAKLRRPSHR